jgi:diacylglycerol kinase family enzyme
LAVRLPHDRRDVLISINPRAGFRSRHVQIEAIVAALRESGFRIRTTTSLDELNGLAAEGMSTGNLRAVVAIGGDGTALTVRNNTPLEVPLLVVPTGTENLLGRYVGQGTDPAAVCDVIENGVVAELDLGLAAGKYFLLMISAGFDAEVIRTLHENRRGNISRATYVLPTLRSMRSYEYSPMRLYWDAAEMPGAEPHTCRWLFGFNLPLYAFGLPIAPNAVATDGKLDLCTFEHGAAWSVARYLWHVMRSMHHTLPDAVVRHAGRFRLEAVGGAKIPYQLDGDYAGTLPVDVEVLPGQLRLLVSATAARRLGVAVPEH